MVAIRDKKKASNGLTASNNDDVLENEYPLIGKFLKEIREELGFSQKEFCEKVKLNQPTVSLIENGDYALKFAQVLQISDGLGIDPLSFITKMFDRIRICPDLPTLKIEDYDSIVTETKEKIKNRRKEILVEQLDSMNEKYS